MEGKGQISPTEQSPKDYSIFDIIETTKNKRIYFEATNYLFDYARLNIMEGFLSVL